MINTQLKAVNHSVCSSLLFSLGSLLSSNWVGPESAASCWKMCAEPCFYVKHSVCQASSPHSHKRKSLCPFFTFFMVSLPSWLTACKCHLSPADMPVDTPDLLSPNLSERTLILIGDWHGRLVCPIVLTTPLPCGIYLHAVYVSVSELLSLRHKSCVGACDSWCHSSSQRMSQRIRHVI